MAAKRIQKTLDKPPVPKWEDYDSIIGRTVGWLCCVILLVIVLAVGPVYVVFGESFDKKFSRLLLELEDWIGVKL